MSKNVIRLQQGIKKDSYELVQSGFGEGNFLTAAQFRLVKVGNANLICFEEVPRDIRFGPLENDVSSFVKEVSNNYPYAADRVLGMAREKFDQMKQEESKAGYTFEDLTRQ